jgi:general secretion pathway protein A
MYEDHYGLTARPFGLTPDARFWYETATHKRAMAYLGYGLSQGEGFIVITGEIGAGKTTLMGHLVEGIDPAALNVITLVSTQIAAEDLLRGVCAGLDVDPTGLAKADMLRAIERGLHAVARDGRRTLLIVDEAQALPVESLEELRMLSNFQAGGFALLQIFLLGQPEFRDALADARLEQLRQRVIAMHHLGPMEADEVAGYLEHRLDVAGSTGRPAFDRSAVAAMHGWSGGIPRRLNVLATRMLLYGAIERIDVFAAEDVNMVAADLAGDTVAPELTEPELPLDARPILAEPELPDVAAPIAAEQDAPVEWPIEREGDPLPSGEPDVPEGEPTQEDKAEAVNLDAPGWELDDEPKSAEPVSADVISLADASIDRRLAAIEARLDEQDAALRRVLTLLVDWIEEDRRPDLSGLRGSIG